jgi:hypothetical protein
MESDKEEEKTYANKEKVLLATGEKYNFRGKEKNILQDQIWDPCSLWFSGSNQLQYNEKAENKEGEKKWKEER